jgi:ribosomal protein S2
MKIKKIQHNHSKLLKLKLIKSKILKKDHIIKNLTVESIESRLKKALKIIYSYHINNKKILFVGNSLNINKEIVKLLQNTNHIFIPKSAWIAGIITNTNPSFKFLLKKSVDLTKISQRVLQLKKKSDLVVIMDQNLDLIALEESYSSKLPVITLNSNLNPFDNKSSYKVPGNFIFSKNKLKNNFFYSILLSTLKKSNLQKKKFKCLTHKLRTISVFKKSKKSKKYSKK